MKKIIIGNEDHTLFYFCQAENAVFLTHEQDRAERFNNCIDAAKTIEQSILPYPRWIHEYRDDKLEIENMFVWQYEYTIDWKML